MDKKTCVLVIGDRSGSMAPLLPEAVGGFNNFLHDQQKLGANIEMTFVLFDDQYDPIYIKSNVANIADMTTEKWLARGLTALLDAIGKGIADFNPGPDEQAVVVIITDGHENASKEFTRENIKKLIEDKEKLGWKFIFLASDKTAILDAASFGISAGSTYAFTANAVGTMRSYDAVSHTVSCYATNGTFDTTALEDLDK
jgi:Mg-chelatase subunit ChlD